MNLLSILAKLQAAGIGRVGIDMFAHQMPLEVSEGILIKDRFSGDRIDHELPGWREGGFQLVVRAKDFQTGKTLAQQAMGVLNFIETPLDATCHIKYMRPRHEPVSYPISPGNLIEFSVNFETAYVMIG